MTTSNTNDRSGPYAGDGASVNFTVSFYFLTSAELLVTRLNADSSTTVLSLGGGDYSVAGAGNPSGGTITLSSGTLNPVGATLTITPMPSITQQQAYPAGGTFPSLACEQGFDRLTIISLFLQEQINRCLKLSVTTSVSGALGPIVANPVANAALVFSADATQLIPGPTAGDIAGAQGYAAAANASAVSAAASAASSSTSASSAASSASAAAASAAIAAGAASRYTSVPAYNTNSTLTNVAQGALVTWYGGSDGTITAPASGTLDVGGWIEFENQANSTLTIPFQGSDLLYGNAGAPGVASIAVLPGESLKILYEGVANVYLIAGGLGSLKFSRTFNSGIGGFKNRHFNANCVIGSRGDSGTIGSNSFGYTCDQLVAVTVGAALTWNRIDDFTMPDGSYAGGAIQFIGNTGMTSTTLTRKIESIDASELAGQQCTTQATIFNGTGGTITPTLLTQTVTTKDNFGTVATDLSSVNFQPIANGATGTIAYTYPVSANAFKGYQTNIGLGSALNNSGATGIYITAFDTRVTKGVPTGINYNPPTPELRPKAEEEILCGRYLQSFGKLAGPIGTGAATTTSAAGFFIPYKGKMKSVATGITVTTVGDFEICDFAGTDVAALTGMTFSKASAEGVFVTCTVSGTPLTAAKPYLLYAKTALAGNLLITQEL